MRICYELKKEINQKLKIMVSFVVTNQNEDEVDILREKVTPYIDNYLVHPLYIRQYCENETRNKLEPKIKRNKIDIPCFMVFTRLHITYDGFLTGCCQDFKYDLLLADLKTTPLEEAWKSRNAIELRKAHLSKNVDGLLCNNCIQKTYQKYNKLLV